MTNICNNRTDCGRPRTTDGGSQVASQNAMHRISDSRERCHLSDTPELFLCVFEGIGPFAGRVRVLDSREPRNWESGSRKFCRNFTQLSTSHVIDLVEEILSDNGTVLHAYDGAIVITTSDMVNVLREWWHRLR